MTVNKLKTETGTAVTKNNKRVRAQSDLEGAVI